MTYESETGLDEADTMSRDHIENPFAEEFATFGDRLAVARDAQGLSVSEVAERLGVSKRTILSWEEDRSEPRANRIQMLCGILNVSLMWLMTGEGEGGPSGVSHADPSHEVGAILSEIAALQVDQRRISEKLARLEKRVRALRFG